MTRRPSLMVVCGVVPALVVACLSMTRPAMLTGLQFAAYDTVLRATPTTPPDGRVVIVDVDEKSLSTIGQWPWRRDLMARLVAALRDRGAAAVALDIIFAERDRYEGTDLQPDAVLADALRPGRVVLGYGMTFDASDTLPPPCVEHALGLAVIGGDDGHGPPYFEATGAICSLPALVQAAGASGFLNAAPDSDGLLRRAPLLIELNGRVYPSLGLAAVSAMIGATDPALHVSNVNASALELTGRGTDDLRPIPLDAKSNLLLRFRGVKRTFPYVSAADVLNGRVEDDVFEGKLILVGTTALGTREVVSTPLDTLFTGVEVQATIADNLLRRDFIRTPGFAVALETLLAIVVALFATLVVRRFGLAGGAVGAGVAFAACWIGSIAVLAVDGAFVSPLFPSLALCASMAAMVVAGVTVERHRADVAGRERETSRRLMIQTLLSLTEIKDSETGKHSRRTQQFARVLAQALARHDDYAGYLTPDRIELLATLAPLHDIGKVGVPDSVLNKPGALTSEELVEMRKHPVHGRDVILNAQREAGVHDDVTLAVAKDIVYTHHEKWDGTGYPEGLKGSAIPIPGRVMAIVDVYDACTTRRLYAPPLSQEDAVALIVRGRGTHFDPAVVDAFLTVAPIFRSLSEAADH
jgi:CHASE2 domain-containing sensor protein